MWITSGLYVDNIQITLWVKWVNRCDPFSTLNMVVIKMTIAWHVKALAVHINGFTCNDL